jgi:CDGSH-type Zn-finger protein
MGRLIKHCAKGPLEIEEDMKGKWMCRCGLSSNQHYCNSSHKKTLTEEEPNLYIYKNGEQIKVEDPFSLDCSIT